MEPSRRLQGYIQPAFLTTPSLPANKTVVLGQYCGYWPILKPAPFGESLWCGVGVPGTRLLCRILLEEVWA